MKKNLLTILLLSLLAFSSAFAQSRKITGKVTNADDGQPLPGVSVQIQGQSSGTQTNVDGIYSIEVSSATKALVFSYIGVTTQVVKLNDAKVINVKLVTDSRLLTEVVVVPYGAVKKEAITGSVAVLGTKDIEKRTVTSVTSALAGLAPGIQVMASNGQPGNSTAIRIRGFGSFNASNAALIVVDGSVFDGNIGDINTNDIDNVSVLKDASASALYGSRASNGVVMITTKKAKSAIPTVNAQFNQGFSTRGIPEYDKVSTLEYYPFVWQAIKNNLMFSASPTQSDAVASANASATVASNLVYNPFNVPANSVVGTDGKLNPNASLLYNDFDWFSPLLRTGKRTDATINTSAKTEKTDYYVSLGYLSDNGYLLKTDFRRFNARINANTKIKSWLKTGLNLSASTSDGNVANDAGNNNAAGFSNPFAFARGIGPIYPVHAFDATTGAPIYNSTTKDQWYDYGAHPGAINRPSGASPGRNVVDETILNQSLYSRNLMSARSYVDVKFLKDFTFTPSISIDMRSNTTNIFQNPVVGDGAGSGGTSQATSDNIRSYTFNQILTYNKTINKHSFNILAGHENYDYTFRTFNAFRTAVISQNNYELDNFVTSNSSGGNSDRDRIESYLSKASYSYDDKYFLDASLRTDGSSRFASAARWGTFFSVGGGWSISKEHFMDKTNSWLDDLKLKVSYGQVGNNNTASYYPSPALYDLGFNNNSEAGALLSQVANPNLKWESQNTFNTGLDFSFFKRRLYGSIEFYKKSVDNLLFAVPQPLSDPVTTINQNIGSMYNQGVELQLGGDILHSRNFNWNLLTNWSVLKNRITKLPVETPTIISGTKRREVGQDYYSFYLRQYAGVDPSDGSALYIPADGTAASNIRTVNGVQYVTNQSFAKMDYSGSAIPDLMGSFTNTFTYKGLSLSVLMTYQLGGKFYDSQYQGLMSTASYGSSYAKDILQSWTPANPTSNIPRADFGATTNTNATSNRFLISASYIQLRNVNLSYTLPKGLLGKLDVSNIRIFATGENLFLSSKRKGLDPTESFDGTNSTTYTQSRVVSFGANISF